MKVISDDDLPIQYGIEAMASFIIHEEQFNIKCILNRKEVNFNQPKIIYGIKFVDLNKSIESRLGKIINELQIEKRNISKANV